MKTFYDTITGRFDPNGSAKFILIKLDDFSISKFNKEKEAFDFIIDSEVSSSYLLVDMNHAKYIKR
jgi:hypothetical protein